MGRVAPPPKKFRIKILKWSIDFLCHWFLGFGGIPEKMMLKFLFFHVKSFFFLFYQISIKSNTWINNTPCQFGPIATHYLFFSQVVALGFHRFSLGLPVLGRVSVGFQSGQRGKVDEGAALPIYRHASSRHRGRVLALN